MSEFSPSIFVGDVVHKRVHPIEHRLSYKVFTILVDCDCFARNQKFSSLFSLNRFNLFSLYERDYGDGKNLSRHLRQQAEKAGLAHQIKRFTMLTYPRILGYAFNPLTVYFGLDADEKIVLTLYEVNNTFGEKKTYVIPAQEDENGLVWQKCPKQFFVSPFNKVSGHYDFHLRQDQDEISVGVALKDEKQPILRAHFRGQSERLTNRNLLRNLRHTGFMTIAVITAIHWHALRIWMKGLRLQDKPKAAKRSISIFRERAQTEG